MKETRTEDPKVYNASEVHKTYISKVRVTSHITSLRRLGIFLREWFINKVGNKCRNKRQVYTSVMNSILTDSIKPQ